MEDIIGFSFPTSILEKLQSGCPSQVFRDQNKEGINNITSAIRQEISNSKLFIFSILFFPISLSSMGRLQSAERDILHF